MRPYSPPVSLCARRWSEIFQPYLHESKSFLEFLKNHLEVGALSTLIFIVTINIFIVTKPLFMTINPLKYCFRAIYMSWNHIIWHEYPIVGRNVARRSQKTIARELDQLEELLRQHPVGLSRDEIEEFVNTNWDRPLLRRTLLRRLKVLEEEDRIIVEGQGRSTLYKVADTVTPPPQVSPVADAEAEIPLSESGTEIRALILRPITRRAPVGYDRSFLEDYTPGHTWYLPGPMRQRLHDRGSTPDPNRPAGTYAREIYENLLIDLSWASSRLEGNTYSRIDTASLIKFGRAAEGKDATEAQMVLNHKRAIDFLVENAESLAFDRRTLLTLHSMLAENLVGDPGDEGRLRRRMVQITGTSYTPVAIPQVIEDSFALFLSRADAIEDPFEQAFFTMVHLPYLQPFIDVNKRTSRLAANIPLFRANLCPLSFIDVPRELYLQATLSIYETQRVELLRDVF